MLGNSNRIKIFRFLAKNDEWQFNLSEIARKIGVDKGSLSRLIESLEQEHMLVVKKSGKLLLFKVDEKYAQYVKEVFAVENKWKK